MLSMVREVTLFFLGILFLFHSATHAKGGHIIEADRIYVGSSLEPVTLKDLISHLHRGSVVIVSEYHGFAPHHDKQVNALEFIEESFPNSTSVGMEFLEFPEQNIVDLFLSKTISEEQFLKDVKWGEPSFDFYRRQTLFPQKTGGKTIALNAPRSLTAKIAQKGLDSLTKEERVLLPPNFTLGSQKYFDRFKEIMGEHVTPEQLERYFAAQSVWDETMAWSAEQYVVQNPNRILVIIVGDFHNAYYLGLPARLKARGVHVLTISQSDLTDLTQEQAINDVGPNEKWGARADFVWTSISEKGKTPFFDYQKYNFNF